MKYDAKFISYPSSGRTWIRFMLMNFYLPRRRMNDKGQMVGDLFSEDLPSLLFMTHDTAIGGAHGSLEELVERHTDCKIIFLIRDPRDTMVSIYFTGHRAFVSDDYIDLTTCKRYPIDVWIKSGVFERFLDWLCLWDEAINDPRLTIEVIRYEDFLGEPLELLKEVLSFLNIDSPNEKIEKAVESASFKNMRKMQDEGKTKEARKWLIPKTYQLFLDSKFHMKYTSSGKVRQGTAGDYKNKLNPESIKYCNQLMIDSDCGLIKHYET